MSLRDKLGLSSGTDHRRLWYENFGTLENPFPPASQTGKHPHLETDADDKIIQHLRQFGSDHRTQAIVIEGRQGVGKTNLLLYFKDELDNAFDSTEFRLIRYEADPEIGFDAVIKRFLQEFGAPRLASLGKILGGKPSGDLEKILGGVRDAEVRAGLRRLSEAGSETDKLNDRAELLLNWLLGLRVLKRHTQELNVHFRLDTMESQSLALRDLVHASVAAGFLKGIYLLLDELEKHTVRPDKQIVVNYLQGLRAFIDALPTHLFLVLSITPEARVRYFVLVPALAGRLSTRITIDPLLDLEQAKKLADFYGAYARQVAKNDPSVKGWQRGTADAVSELQVQRLFTEMSSRAEKIGEQGVAQRSYLDGLRRLAERRFQNVAGV